MEQQANEDVDIYRDYEHQRDYNFFRRVSTFENGIFDIASIQKSNNDK